MGGCKKIYWIEDGAENLSPRRADLWPKTTFLTLRGIMFGESRKSSREWGTKKGGYKNLVSLLGVCMMSCNI